MQKRLLMQWRAEHVSLLQTSMCGRIARYSSQPRKLHLPGWPLHRRACSSVTSRVACCLRTSATSADTSPPEKEPPSNARAASTADNADEEVANFDAEAAAADTGAAAAAEDGHAAARAMSASLKVLPDACTATGAGDGLRAGPWAAAAAAAPAPLPRNA